MKTDYWGMKKRKKINRVRKLKPFSDYDKDKVVNIFDCQPRNRRKQGWGHETTVPLVDYPESFGKIGKTVAMTPGQFMRAAQRTSSDPSMRDMPPEMYEERVIVNSKGKYIKKLGRVIKSKHPKARMRPGYLEWEDYEFAEGFRKRKLDKPRLTAHEGRHRAVAAREVGEKRIPVRLIAPKGVEPDEWKSYDEWKEEQEE